MTGPARTLWRVAGPARGSVLRGLCWKAAQAVAEVLPLAGLVVIIHQAVEPQPDLAVAAAACAAIAVGYLAAYGCAYRASLGLWTASYRLVGEFRLRLLRALAHVPLGYVAGRPAGRQAG